MGCSLSSSKSNVDLQIRARIERQEKEDRELMEGVSGLNEQHDIFVKLVSRYGDSRESASQQNRYVSILI